MYFSIVGINIQIVWNTSELASGNLIAQSLHIKLHVNWLEGKSLRAYFVEKMLCFFFSIILSNLSIYMHVQELFIDMKP